MNAPDHLVWLVLPAFVVWVVTVADIATRPGIGPAARGLWILATTLLFPVALVWYLVRPVDVIPSVRLDAPDPADPRAVLAGAADARSRGEVDRASYENTLTGLFEQDAG